MMNKERRIAREFLILLVIAPLIALSACGGSISELKGQTTVAAVTLEKNNYKVIKAGAKGESMGFYLLGFIPIVNPGMAKAKESLYASVGQSLEGRAIALVNQTEDRNNIYLVLFSIPTITISADIIEYLDEGDRK
ncbi:MAG: hypothetical protein COT35_03295 [Nitrospirae bacterium CG08_land_8_20_14_0_20_52_24]|nr:MAG: hypothetical protein COT35_03295 [Nitrospirae bacterium CG08_land_8_20_14_0_20_52_24]PIV85016.1 MAG: hypothetical protein COW52_04505 [Nitrospirae bacterium CG17_big_fil_post_rev_8_21_14_2_50_50_9]PIX85786.1 MAG: hypothetical protein COZ32_06685 [Nitrospirae bacterium CG_4_10_14_3_um_filter_53_41]